jgi:hypothetical protein
MLGRQQSLVRGAGRRRRLHAQLLLERRDALVVHAQRPRPVPALVVQAHQPAVRRLGQRVQHQRALRVRQRRVALATRLQQRANLVERGQRQPAQPITLGHQPLVVPAVQQVTRVQVDRPQLVLEGALPGLLEGGHVRPVTTPGQRLPGDVQRLGDRGPQGMQDVAEVGAGLFLSRVRPQQERQVVPALRPTPLEHQVRQQAHGPARGERDRRPVQADLGRTEQTDLDQHHGHHAMGYAVNRSTHQVRYSRRISSTAGARTE